MILSFRVSKANIDVSERFIKEGNEELKAIIAGKKSNVKKELTSAQGKIDMGLCRKHKIAKEHDELAARKKKLMQYSRGH